MNKKYIHPPKKIHLNDLLYKKPGWVYSFTICANFHQNYFVKDKFNLEIIDCLKEEKEKINCFVYLYCLMPDHLHLLSGTSSEDISVLTLINRFKGKSTRIGWKYGIRGSLWQKRNYDHILRKSEDILKAAEYILNNPIRRGLVKFRNEYKYSGCWDKLPSW